MGKHRRTSKKKLAPTLVLALSIASVSSPLIALFFTEPRPTPTPTPTPNFLAESTLPPSPATVRSHESVLSKAKRVAPTYLTNTTPPAKTRTPTAKPQPITTTLPTATVRQEAQRTTQSSPKPTTTTAKPPPRTTTTPKPQTPKQTTTPPPPPQPKPQPPPLPPSPQSSAGSKIVSVAKRYVNAGIPYTYGGNSLTGGMDCSHFIWMVLKEAGFNVQYRDSGGLAAWATRVSNPQPGDLVLYAGHAGIYVSPGMMIDQGRSGGAYLRSIYKDNFIGYGRLPI